MFQLTPDDLALARRILGGDEAAFQDLFARCQRGMRAAALAIVGSPATADEVVQDAWVAILSGLSRFEGRSSLKTWAMRILANRARTRAQRDRRVTPLAEEDLAASETVDPARFDATGHWISPPAAWGDAEARLSAAQLAAQVREAVEGLPPRQRAVVVLRDVEGLEPAEVCALLDLSEGNQRVLLHRGRAAVRDILDRGRSSARDGGKP